ncbi:hypothetical protein M0R72_19700 [Candidatus Pacearchaeota archaeon]|jgi:hypothetical protein|nr:hypothetical protein [Candidatus Pacearchaeota archaeon]
MDFDIEKARETCDELLHPGEDCGASCQFCDEAKTLLPAALDEIEQLRKSISEPLEAFGTPELITWNQELTRLLDVPEIERGGWPFVLSVGCHLEKFAKSWNSQTMAEQAKHIQALESDLKYAQEGCQHGRQEHARLAAILGESDALYVLAQQIVDRNAKFEAALIEPAKLMLTAEQKAAINDALYWMPTPKCGASVEVLRVMLTEAKP